MSAIKNILLHVDASAASAARLQIARDLAARHGACVTALFGAATDLGDRAYGYSAGAALEGGSTVHDEARAALQRGAFDDGPQVAWFDMAGESQVRGFVAEAAYADLLVLGAEARGQATSDAAPRGFVEAVVIEGGKPVLLIPTAAGLGSIGQRVLVAWDGSAAAARALAGALPLLKAALEVHVATWSRGPTAGPFSRAGVVAYLERHGISAVLQQREPAARVGAEIVALAGAIGADLVVMGCYGHNRVRERVFGGTTRWALRATNVALLMAH